MRHDGCPVQPHCWDKYHLKLSCPTALSEQDPIFVPKDFSRSNGTMLECCGVVITVSVVANEAEIFLVFHVYNNPDIPILIGRPTERLSKKRLW
jgi:hypothetical protein